MWGLCRLRPPAVRVLLFWLFGARVSGVRFDVFVELKEMRRRVSRQSVQLYRREAEGRIIWILRS